MKGWDHIGAPGAWGDVIFDTYQRSGTSVASKLFRVTTPHNQQTDFEHALVDAPLPRVAEQLVCRHLTRWPVAGIGRMVRA